MLWIAKQLLGIDRVRYVKESIQQIDFKEKSNELAPFLSLVIIIFSLFCVVFFKMEIRRMGYSVLRQTREERKLRDFERQQMVQLAKITRPGRLQSVAQNRLTLKRADAHQIVQMTDLQVVAE